MSDRLFTFLGKVPPSEDGYRTATYRFPDGDERTESFSGFALEEWQAPGVVVVLGTTGSMWHVLLELTGRFETAPDLWARLEAAFREEAVTQADLDALSAELTAARGRPWRARLIPYGRDQEEQAAILRAMADEVPEDARVTLDVTHGLRHLPMVALVSALQLRILRAATIAGFYYGALEMTSAGTTPVVPLDGLLEATEWLQALHTYDKDGDYAVFADLYRREGVGEKAVGHLEEAAFHERTTNPALARQDLITFEKATPTLATPIGGLFADELWRRIQWHRQTSRAEWERSLARLYLARRDYLRAALFAQEAYITRRMQRRGGKNFHEHTAREAVRNSIKAKHFQQLKKLRNALAHGNPPDDGEVRAALGSEAGVRALLEAAFRALLDEDGGWNAGD